MNYRTDSQSTQVLQKLVGFLEIGIQDALDIYREDSSWSPFIQGSPNGVRQSLGSYSIGVTGARAVISSLLNTEIRFDGSLLTKIDSLVSEAYQTVHEVGVDLLDLSTLIDIAESSEIPAASLPWLYSKRESAASTISRKFLRSGVGQTTPFGTDHWYDAMTGLASMAIRMAPTAEASRSSVYLEILAALQLLLAITQREVGLVPSVETYGSLLIPENMTLNDPIEIHGTRWNFGLAHGSDGVCMAFCHLVAILPPEIDRGPFLATAYNYWRWRHATYDLEVNLLQAGREVQHKVSEVHTSNAKGWCAGFAGVVMCGVAIMEAFPELEVDIRPDLEQLTQVLSSFSNEGDISLCHGSVGVAIVQLRLGNALGTYDSLQSGKARLEEVIGELISTDAPFSKLSPDTLTFGAAPNISILTGLSGVVAAYQEYLSGSACGLKKCNSVLSPWLRSAPR